MTIPAGTSENSPAIYRWESDACLIRSPEGTTEEFRFLSFLRVSNQTIRPVPRHELLGYYQLSLTAQKRMNEIGEHYLEDALRTFRNYKNLAERAFRQTGEDDFFRTIDDESNSVAILVKHMASNMLSRWLDFLTTDGEKPNRNRDMEFVMLPETTKEEMLAYWEQGWASL